MHASFCMHACSKSNYQIFMVIYANSHYIRELLPRLLYIMSTPVQTFPITLVNAFMLSPFVKHFVFTCEQNPLFNFIPGQFITIHFEHQDKMLKRSYSIANAPIKDNQIEFAAGFVENGPGTELLFHLSPGDKIHINGPFGRLILKESLPKRYVFVATSTGITPYRAMLPELKKRLIANPELQILILFGVQSEIEALYQEEWIALSTTFPEQVKLRFQFSRAKEISAASYQYRGYVQHAFPEVALNPIEDMVYLCGNPAMIDEAFEYLKGLSFPMQQIIREKYISAR